MNNSILFSAINFLLFHFVFGSWMIFFLLPSKYFSVGKRKHFSTSFVNTSVEWCHGDSMHVALYFEWITITWRHNRKLYWKPCSLHMPFAVYATNATVLFYYNIEKLSSVRWWHWWIRKTESEKLEMSLGLMSAHTRQCTLESWI